MCELARYDSSTIVFLFSSLNSDTIVLKIVNRRNGRVNRHMDCFNAMEILRITIYSAEKAEKRVLFGKNDKI